MGVKPTKIEQGFFLLIAGVLVLFARGLLEAFDLSKAILTWALGILAMWGIAGSVHFRKGQSDLLREQWPIAALLVATILATVTSDDVRRSIFGQDHRFTGLITIISCLAIASFSASIPTEVVIRSLRRWVGLATPLICGYAILQFLNRDPFQWSITSFGGAPFSTLGNPNVLAACVAILMPLVYSGLISHGSIGARLNFGICFALLAAVASMANSFQVLFGPLATFVLVLLTSRAESGRFRVSYGTLLDLITILLSAVLTLLSLRESIGKALMVLVVASLAIRVLANGEGFRRPLLEISYKKLGILGLAVSPALFMLLRDQIEKSGYERSAFYRAVFSAFMDRPILGFGLENFGRIFPQYRPLWHAQELELSLTNSPHSVILGTLVTGGLILFAATLTVFSVALYRSWKRWRASTETEFSAAQLSSILAVTAIFFVSVESVPLFVLGFALIGSGLRVEGEFNQRFDRRNRRASSLRRPNQFGAISAMAGTVFTLVAAFPVVAAEIKLQDGMDALYLDGRPDLAEPLLSRVVELRPDEFRYRLQLANSLLYQQEFERALDEMIEAVKASNYNTIIVLDVKRILLELGRDDLASEITDQAKARDKFAPSL